MPEIRKMLVLSTAHIPKRLAEGMDEYPNGENLTPEVAEELSEVVFDCIEYGYLLWVNEDDALREALPPEIQTLYAYADKHGCRGEYIKLDCDGTIEPDLPTWEW